MRPRQDRDVGRRPHASSRRAGIEQQPILVAKSHVHRLAIAFRGMCLPWPMNLLLQGQFASAVTRRFASPNLPNDQPLEPSGFRQKVALNDRPHPELDLR
jgi:hypothetical protein